MGAFAAISACGKIISKRYKNFINKGKVMKKICLSLLLMIGVSVFASGGGGGSKDACGGAARASWKDSVVAFFAKARRNVFGDKAPDKAKNMVAQVVLDRNPHALAGEITKFLSGRDMMQLGLVSKSLNKSARFARAARATPGAKRMQVNNQHLVATLHALSDGRVVSTGVDGAVKLLNVDITSDAPQILVQRGGFVVFEIAVLPGDRLAVGFADSSVQIINPNDPDSAPLQLGHTALDRPIKAMTVLPSGRLLGVVSDWLHMWDPAAPDNEPEFLLNHVNRVALLSNGNVVIILKNGSIMIWNPLGPVADSLLLGRSDGLILHLLALSDGNFILVLFGGCIQMWNPATPGVDPVLVGRCDRVVSLAALRNGSFITGSFDGKVYVLNPATPASDPVLLRDFEQIVWCLVELPDGRIAAGLADETVQVLPTEEYFERKEQDLRKKVLRTQDPRDYERDGTAVYDILFDNYAFNRWFDRKIQGQMVTVRDLKEKMQSRFSTEEVRQNARDENIEMQNEIVDVVKLWLKNNFALEDENLTAQDSSQADLLIVQAKKIVEGLLHQQLIDAGAQRIELFDRDQSVRECLDLLQTFVKKYEAPEKRNAFYGISTRRALYPGESLSDYQENVFDSGCSATERDLSVEGCESQASVVAVEDSSDVSSAFDFTQWNGCRGY